MRDAFGLGHFPTEKKDAGVGIMSETNHVHDASGWKTLFVFESDNGDRAVPFLSPDKVTEDWVYPIGRLLLILPYLTL